MLPFRIVNKFIRFPSVIDMHMAGDQCRRHMFVKATSQNYVNVIHRFAPMGGASREQEYPPKGARNNGFDINYGKMKGQMVLDSVDRSIINCKITI